MRLGTLAWLSLAACNPLDRDARAIAFAAPVPRVVLAGDSVASICAELGASEADVRAWNALERREPAVGEIVHVWRTPRVQPTLASVIGDPARPEAGRARQEAGRARSAARPARARVAAVAMPSFNLRDWMLPPAASAPPVAAAPVEAVSLEVDATRVHSTGLLGGARIETGGVGDLDVDGWTARRGTVGATSLAARGSALADRGAAESLGQVAALRALGQPTAGGNYVPNTPVRPPALSKPAPKRCLNTSTAVDLGDEGMAGSKGLSSAQVRAALAPFGRHTSACIPSGATGSWSASFGVTIGCDGRVSAAWTLDPGGLPDAVTRCIETTLGAAGFPAHDMPAGVDITWPITYRK